MENVIEEVIELAGRRARLELELESINRRLEELRGAPKALPPASDETPKPKRGTKTARPPKASQRSPKGECAKWLAKYLSKGPKLTADVMHDGYIAGYGKTAIYRARNDLRIKSRKVDGNTAEWSLPG